MISEYWENEECKVIDIKLTCLKDICTGVGKMIHVTASLHGGVVSDPL